MVFHGCRLDWCIVVPVFYCPNVGNGYEDKYYMQKGRDKNECKEQEKCSEHKDGVKEQTSS